MQAALRFSTPNMQPILQVLDKKRESLKTELRAVFEQHGQAMMQQTSELSPVEEGFMAANVVYEPLDEMIGFTVGWHGQDFADAGKDPHFIYQEFGTVHMTAQPTLGPVGRQGLPVLKRDVEKLLRKHFGGL